MSGVVSRHDWVHGSVACPSCALPLDKARDHGEYLWGNDDARAYGVEGMHEGCGFVFRFEFDDGPPRSTEVPRDRPRDRRRRV
jgi:hypothetical protein